MAGELTLFYAKLATDPNFYNQLKRLNEAADLNRFLEAQELSPEQIVAVKSCDFKTINEAVLDEQKGPIYIGGVASCSTQSIRKPPRKRKRPRR